MDYCNEEGNTADKHEVRGYGDGLVPLHEFLGGVDVCGPYLVGLRSYRIGAQRAFILAKYIFICVHISNRYGSVYHVVVFYIVFLVLDGGSPNDTMYLTR